MSGAYSFRGCKAAVGLAAILAWGTGQALAQAGPYTNDTNAPINGTTGCGAIIVRNISVGDSFTITDVNFGIDVDHTWRKDVSVLLESPAGTRVQVITAPADNPGADDLNVLLDDAGASTIDADDADHDSTAARWEFTRQPDAALSAFNGEAANGTWIVEICDTFTGADNGTFDYAQLYFNNIVPLESDLSLTLGASATSPNFGDNVTMTVTVANAGPDATTGVTVDYALPSGLSYVSDNGSGAYNSGTGVWTIPGSVASSGSASLQILANVQTSGSYVSITEVSASDNLDPDSTPANSGTSPLEDDTASVTLTPGATGGTGPSGEPNLSCASPDVFDWDTNAWPYNVGVLSRSYPGGGTDGTDFTISVSGDTGFRDASSPETSSAQTGGLSPVQQSLYYLQNLSATTQSADFTIDVGVPGTGVKDFQFTIFDIDYAAGQFRDQISIQGTLNGSTVTPVLTTGSANTAVGSVAYGTAAAGSTSGNGNLIITFLSPVDQIIVNYANPEASAANSNQAMAIHDFNYCPRPIDFGDALISYGTPSHAIKTAVYIGATEPDGEASAAPSANADGDDVAGTDDEDSIDFSGLVTGGTSNLNVDVSGSGGYLQAWIDWNGDGDFNDTVDTISEQVATDVQIVGTSGTASFSVSVPASATLSQTISRFRWSTTSGLGLTGLASDGEIEDHALTLTGAASLTGAKTTNVYDPAADGLYAIPGNDVIYTITVTNAGTGPADNDSIELIDAMPAEVEFYNGDIDDAGPETDPVAFTETSSGLTLTYGTDVAFSDAILKPADFASCTLTTALSAGYNSHVTYICFNPKGAFAAGDPDPEFTVSFRARIK